MKYLVESRAALRAPFDKLTGDGIKSLHYLEGESLLGDDGEATTDGSHPHQSGNGPSLGRVRSQAAQDTKPIVRPLFGTSERAIHFRGMALGTIARFCTGAWIVVSSPVQTPVAEPKFHSHFGAIFTWRYLVALATR